MHKHNNTTSNKNSLTTVEKEHLIAQLADYQRVLTRQLEVQKELLMLHMELIPMLIHKSEYKSYVERWAHLVRQLR